MSHWATVPLWLQALLRREKQEEQRKEAALKEWAAMEKDEAEHLQHVQSKVNDAEKEAALKDERQLAQARQVVVQAGKKVEDRVAVRPASQPNSPTVQQSRGEEKGTPVGVVYRARGPSYLAAGRTSLSWPTRCFGANALNLRPPLSPNHPRSSVTLVINVVCPVSNKPASGNPLKALRGPRFGIVPCLTLIFLVVAVQLVAHREYSQSMVFYWSHTGNILSRLCSYLSGRSAKRLVEPTQEFGDTL